MPKRKTKPADFWGGPASPVPGFPDILGAPGKFAANLGRALGNLNTVAKVTGQLAQAIAPGSIAANVGRVGEQMGSAAATGKAYQYLMAGQPIPKGTSTQELITASQLAGETRRAQAYETMAEKTPSVKERKEMIVLGEAAKAKRPPTPFQAYTGEKGQIGTYFLAPQEGAPGGYEPIEVGTGTPARALGTLSPDALLKSQQAWYNKAIEIAKGRVGKYVMDPDTGQPVFVMTDPAKGQVEFNRIAASLLTEYAKDGLIPVEWINNVPALYTAPEPAKSEIQSLMDREIFKHAPSDVSKAVEEQLNFVGPRQRGYGVGGEY